MTVFYNPVMEFGRDISVLVLAGLLSTGSFRIRRVLDGLAGSGIKGLRFAKEVGNRNSNGQFNVDINDRDLRAHALIEKNITFSGAINVRALNENLVELLARQSYDYIDIDPFGSPVPFFDAAVRALGRNGVLGITATDTAVLCGSYPKTCKRRYGAIPLRCPFMHELAARILLGFCVRQASKYDIAVRPLLVHASDHYVRIYISCKRGAHLADKALEDIGWGFYSKETGDRGLQAGDWPDRRPETIMTQPPDTQWFGPLWTGPLHDQMFLAALRPDDLTLACTKRVTTFLALAREEASAPPLFFLSSKCSKRFRLPTPPLETILETLTSHGHAVCRTHFHPTGFKTSAGMAELERVFRMIVGD